MKRFPTLSLLSALIPTMASAAETDIQTGYFIDSPVSGLYYQTSSNLSGRTDKGSFQYRAGDVVSFFSVMTKTATCYLPYPLKK